MNATIQISTQLTEADLRTAACEIFSRKEIAFDALKDRPWYKNFMQALTFHRGDKILLLENVRDLATLQKLFMQLYVRQLKSSDAELANMVDAIIAAQEAVANLYNSCILKINKQSDLRNLSDGDKVLLLMLLASFDMQTLDQKSQDRLHAYNSSVRGALGVQQPNGTLEVSALDKSSAPDVLYRCSLEQCAVTGIKNLKDAPPRVTSAWEHLAVSDHNKLEIYNAVREEVRIYGIEGLQTKYSFVDDSIDALMQDLELKEMPPTQLSDQPQMENVSAEKSPRGDFEAAKRTIISYCEETQSFKFSSSKAQNSFIESHIPNLATKTVVSFSEKLHILFTTSGVHFLSADRRHVFIRYSDIDAANSSLSSDKKGKFIEIRGNGTDISYRLRVPNPDRTLELFRTLLAEETADRDTQIPLKEMPDDVKEIYGKILIQFCESCSLNKIEALRICYDMMLKEPLAQVLYTYSDHSKEDVGELRELLERLRILIPYPAEDSFAYALIFSMVTLIQFSSGQCRKIKGIEKEQLKKIADILGVRSELIDALCDVGQMPYRVFRKDIAPDEASKLVKNISKQAKAAGVTIESVFSSIGDASRLIYASLGMFGLPAAVGVAKIIKSREIEQAAMQQSHNICNSYFRIYCWAMAIPNEELGQKIYDAAKKTDPVYSHVLTTLGKDCARATTDP